jgi:hypothetical protein
MYCLLYIQNPSRKLKYLKLNTCIVELKLSQKNKFEENKNLERQQQKYH